MALYPIILCPRRRYSSIFSLEMREFVSVVCILILVIEAYDLEQELLFGPRDTSLGRFPR
ncbi:MAG: hypothetical protein Ct9H90mP26_2420 [Methanobacteriota archaeon]|nr:MAG: hypothetical protein Ct9H90mP26_2420 [Euryarchaeota archaeon]